MAAVLLLVRTLADGLDGFASAIDLLLNPTDWDLQLLVWFGGPVLVLVSSQWIFLVPATLCRPARGAHSRSLMLSMTMIAIVVAALFVALVYSLGEAVVILLGGSDLFDLIDPYASGPIWRRALGWTLLPLVLWPASWLFWTPILWIFTRRTLGRGRWQRLVGLLLGGTVVELLVIIPIDIMVRRRTDCYSATGSFFALLFSAFALVWLAGPAIVLPITSRRRRLWAETHCTNCGYARCPSPGPHCPECGFAWQPPSTPAAKPAHAPRSSHPGRAKKKGD